MVTFTPTANLCGDDQGGFDYELSDGTSTDTGHVTVDITCVNDEPVAGDDDASGTEDSDVTISDAALLGNDSDADGTPASPPSPTRRAAPSSLVAGTITFVPDANLCGDDAASFDYTVEDGDGGTTRAPSPSTSPASTTCPWQSRTRPRSMPTRPLPSTTCSPTTPTPTTTR